MCLSPILTQTSLPATLRREPNAVVLHEPPAGGGPALDAQALLRQEAEAGLLHVAQAGPPLLHLADEAHPQEPAQPRPGGRRPSAPHPTLLPVADAARAQAGGAHRILGEYVSRVGKGGILKHNCFPVNHRHHFAGLMASEETSVAKST